MAFTELQLLGRPFHYGKNRKFKTLAEFINPEMGFLDSSVVENLPAKQKTWVQSLCWEHPLEKEMATHSSTLAWEVPWMEERGGLQFMRSQRVGHD